MWWTFCLNCQKLATLNLFMKKITQKHANYSTRMTNYVISVNCWFAVRHLVVTFIFAQQWKKFHLPCMCMNELVKGWETEGEASRKSNNFAAHVISVHGISSVATEMNRKRRKYKIRSDFEWDHNSITYFICKQPQFNLTALHMNNAPQQFQWKKKKKKTRWSC